MRKLMLIAVFAGALSLVGAVSSAQAGWGIVIGNGASISSAIAPASELPLALRPGDHTAMDALPGAISKIPPPTPDLPGMPTR